MISYLIASEIPLRGHFFPLPPRPCTIRPLSVCGKRGYFFPICAFVVVVLYLLSPFLSIAAREVPLCRFPLGRRTALSFQAG